MIIENLPVKAQLALLINYANPVVFNAPPVSMSLNVGNNEVITFPLKGDSRVRWLDEPEVTGKWVERDKRPWLKVVKATHGKATVYAITLTSEGTRRLALLRDVAAKPGDGWKPKATA